MATLLTAAVYDGPPDPSGANVLHQWTPDPIAIAIAVLLATTYLIAVRRLRANGGTWPLGRSVCFLGLGLVSMLAVTVGWVGRYAHTLFWAYTLQIVILLLVTPAFLAFGRPITLARATLSPPRAARLSAVMASRPMRTLTSPLLGPLLIPIVTSAVFFTAVWETSLRHYPAYEALHLVLLVVGTFIALPLAGEEGELGSLTIAFALFVGFLELLVDAFPGIILRLRTALIAPGYYGGVGRPWGRSMLGDQRIGGAILWFVSETIDLPFIAVLVVRWIKADEQEAARVDRALDEIERARAEADRVADDKGLLRSDGAITAADLDRALEPERTVPWWETNPSVFGTRAGQFRRGPRRGVEQSGAAADREVSDEQASHREDPTAGGLS